MVQWCFLHRCMGSFKWGNIYMERCWGAQGMVAVNISKILRNVSYFWFCQRCRACVCSKTGPAGWGEARAQHLMCPVIKSGPGSRAAAGRVLGWVNNMLPMVLHPWWCWFSLVDKMEDWPAYPWTKQGNQAFRTIHKGLGQQTLTTRKSDHGQQTQALCLSGSTVELFSRANGMKCPLGIPTSFLYLIDPEIWPWFCGNRNQISSI